METPNLSDWDVILLNSSAGKDSQAMLTYVVGLAELSGCSDKIVVVHADLGRMEWAGTKELARTQAEHYGLRFEVVARSNGRSLLEEIRQRRKWPSSTVRYCTSYYKREPVRVLMTRLVKELRGRKASPVRILNCLGFRSQESSARAKRVPFSANAQASNGKRVVNDWLPIHDWSEERVWETIHRSGLPHHPAYDLGMPRLSCCFCIFAPRAALLIAGKANPDLLAEYVQVEKEIGHTFRVGLPIADIQRGIQEGEEPGQTNGVWNM